MTHYEASVYTARRLEMLSIVEATLFYLVDRPVVYSKLSGLPFMVSTLLSNLMLQLVLCMILILYSTEGLSRFPQSAAIIVRLTRWPLLLVITAHSNLSKYLDNEPSC